MPKNGVTEVWADNAQRVWRIVKPLGKGGCGEVFLAVEVPVLAIATEKTKLVATDGTGKNNPVATSIHQFNELATSTHRFNEVAASKRQFNLTPTAMFQNVNSLAENSLALEHKSGSPQNNNSVSSPQNFTNSPNQAAHTRLNYAANTFVAIKIIKDRKQYTAELDTMRRLNKHVAGRGATPELIMACRKKKAIVMDFLSETLSLKFEKCGYDFSLKTIVMLAIDMVLSFVIIADADQRLPCQIRPGSCRLETFKFLLCRPKCKGNSLD